MNRLRAALTRRYAVEIRRLATVDRTTPGARPTPAADTDWYPLKRRFYRASAATAHARLFARTDFGHGHITDTRLVDLRTGATW